MKKKAQNLIEFIIVMPLLIVMIFGIIEYSLFWKAGQTVQELALKAAIGASEQLVTDADTIANGTLNPAALKAEAIVQSNGASLGLNNIIFGYPPSVNTAFGAEPYTLYTFSSTAQINVNSVSKPLISLTVDYSNPYNNGVVVQVIYEYKSLFGGVGFSMPNGRQIIIIPSNIEISSTKIQQYINY